MHSALLVPIKQSFEGKRNRFNKAKGQFSVTRIATFLRRRRKLRVPERKTQREMVRGGAWNLYGRFFNAKNIFFWKYMISLVYYQHLRLGMYEILGIKFFLKIDT